MLSLGQPLNQGDQQLFAQLLTIMRSAEQTLAHPSHYRSPWTAFMPEKSPQQDRLAQPQYFFSGDGALAFLLVQPVQEAGSFTAARHSVEALRAILAEVKPRFSDLEFGLTGLPVLENDEMVTSQHDTERASWLALALVAVLYLIVFRGFYYPMLTIGTLLIGIAWALGWLTLTVGHLNILSATFAVMLIAMGDYGVLWVTRYEWARRNGYDVRSALVHTATHVAVGNLTAATALALAFFAAMLADFEAVAELGWSAGCGVLLCALACFTVLPSVLILVDRRSRLAAPRQPMEDRTGWLPGLSGRPRLVIGAALALGVFFAVYATQIHYDHNLLHLQDPNLDAVAWEETLIEHTQGASWHALSYTNTPEEALALKARFEKLPEVSQVVEVASLVPRNQDRKLALLRDIHRSLDNLPPRGTPVVHDRPDGRKVQEALATLDNYLKRLTQPGGVPLLAEVRASAQALRNRLASQSEAMAAGTGLKTFEDRMTNELAENLHCLRDVAEPTPITCDDVPPALRERYIGRSGKWLLRVFAKNSLWNFKPLEHFTEQIRTVDSEATGKPFSTVEGLKSLKSGFLWAGLYALTVIVLVLLADFRRLGNALIAMAPLVLGLLFSLGVLGLTGRPLNPANLIALPLILGVGIDNGVHVLHDYLLRRREGQSTISRAIGRGVLVKALTTMIGFGALMVSSHRGLFGLGFILTLGVCCCMLTALVFLPAVLRLLGPGPAVPSSQEATEQPDWAA